MLDVILTLLNGDLVDSGVTVPIECVDGNLSDHKTVYATLRMQRVPSYQVEEYEYLHKTEDGRKKFAAWTERQSWTDVTQAVTSTEKVEAFERIMSVGMEECFERKKEEEKELGTPMDDRKDTQVDSATKGHIQKMWQKCYLEETETKNGEGRENKTEGVHRPPERKVHQ